MTKLGAQMKTSVGSFHLRQYLVGEVRFGIHLFYACFRAVLYYLWEKISPFTSYYEEFFCWG